MKSTEAQVGGCTLHPVVGPLLFFVSMIVILAVGDQLDGITWRQMVSLSAFPLITGYAAYACGFINGHHEGYMKAEDEHRPNPTENRTGHFVDGTVPPVVLPPDSENQNERK